MLTIAVDAMGGDHAPKSEVEGAVLAAGELNVNVVLVGLEDVVRKELELHPDAANLPIRIQHASEVITMDESVDAIRTKRDSSLRVAAKLLRAGEVDGVVSAGNTG